MKSLGTIFVRARELCLMGKAGSASTEFMLAFPIVISVLMGTIDVTRTFIVSSILQDSARSLSRENQVERLGPTIEEFEAAIRAELSAKSEGFINVAEVAIAHKVYLSMTDVIDSIEREAVPPGGEPNDFVKFHFTYTMKFATPYITDLFPATATLHEVSVVAQNEPL